MRSFFDRTAEKWAEYRKEYVTLGGFVLVFIAMSLSRYKLPHYIFVTFPFAAIMASRYIITAKKNVGTQIGQIFLNGLFWVVLVLGSILFFQPTNWFLPILLLGLFVCWILVLIKSSGWLKLIIASVVTAIAFNLNLAANFYPQLIANYQGSSVAAKKVYENKKGPNEFYWYRAHDHTLDFYAGYIVEGKDLVDLKTIDKGSWVYTNSDGYRDVLREKFPFKVVEQLDDFPVAQLTLAFLHEPTRSEQLDTVYLLEKTR